MLLSVVIPTKNRPIPVAETVRSVFANSYQNFEVFVVDQSESNQTRDALSIYFRDSRFHYLRNSKTGAGSSRNVGIALSRGEVVAITDDDVTVNQNWLELIAAEFSNDPKLEFVCGALTAPPYDRSAGYTPEFWPHPALKDWQMPFKVAGANMSMRRTLFDTVGGFDELSGPGAKLTISDDGDIAFRIMRSGAKWKGCADIEVVHTYGFRPTGPAEALKTSYIDGLSANFGRFARRGDVKATLFYGAQEVLHLLKALWSAIRGEGTEKLATVRAELRGFWRGFCNNPNEGMISGGELREMQATLLQDDCRLASVLKGESYVRLGTQTPVAAR